MPTVDHAALTTNFSAGLSALLRELPGAGTPVGERADWFDRKAALLDIAGVPDLAQGARDEAARIRAGGQ